MRMSDVFISVWETSFREAKGPSGFLRRRCFRKLLFGEPSGDVPEPQATGNCPGLAKENPQSPRFIFFFFTWIYYNYIYISYPEYSIAKSHVLSSFCRLKLSEFEGFHSSTQLQGQSYESPLMLMVI